MNKRFTGNPDKATRISSFKPDLTAGERFNRAMPREGEFDETSRTFRATIATATPVQRRDAKGPFLEVLDPNGLEIEAGADFPLLTDHRPNAREVVGRVHNLEVDGDRVFASLRLANVDDVEPLVQRIRDDVLKHVSAGYAVLKWRETIDPRNPPTDQNGDPLALA